MTKPGPNLPLSAPLLLTLIASLSLCSTAAAQQTATSALPDAPGALIVPSGDTAESSSAQAGPSQGPAFTLSPDRHFNGIISNMGIVPFDAKLPPQTVKDKFILATEDNFNLYSVVAVGVVAGEQLATNATPEFHQGAKGYARYYWHAYANRTIENYAVESLIPSILHEDTRYYRMGQGGVGKRGLYSIKRAFITKTDSGARTFNYSEIIGAGAAAGLSNLYYPSQQRTASNTLQKWGINIAVDAGSFLTQEFYSDVIHAVFHTKNQPSRAP